MNGRKILALAVALCLAAALTACGGTAAPAEVKPSVVTPGAGSATPSPVAEPSPETVPDPDIGPEAEPTPEPEDSDGGGDEPSDDGWEPDWSLLDFTEVEGAVRFVRERYDSRWWNDYGDEAYDHIETLTAYDEEDRVLFEREVDSAGWASEYVYTWGVPCYEYDYETYINSVRYRSNHGDDTLSEDVYETVSNVRFRTEYSGTDGLSRIEYVYDTNGNLMQELTVVPTEEEALPVCVRNYTYDSWDGWLIREVYEEGAGAGIRITTEYEHEDDRLTLERTIGQDFNDGGEYWYETAWEYDEEGNMIAEETRYGNDAVERSEYEYDEVMGTVMRVVSISPNGNMTTTYTYTGWGDVESSRSEYEDTGEVDTLEYEYDVECRLVKLTQTVDYGDARSVDVTTWSYELA